MPKRLTAEQLLGEALVHVESASIRAWAETDHNRPILVRIAQSAIDRNESAGKPAPDPVTLATFIVSQAIGL